MIDEISRAATRHASELNTQAYRQFLVAAGVSGLTLVLIWLLLRHVTRQVIVPIEELAQAAAPHHRGRARGAHARAGGGELRKLCRQFNDMVVAQVSAIDEIGLLNALAGGARGGPHAGVEQRLAGAAAGPVQHGAGREAGGAGGLVAGISHELNTPIGNALMLSTTLSARSKDLAAKAGADGLTRSGAEEFSRRQHRDRRAAGEHAVNTAAALVSRFKQLAVGQPNEQRQPFVLGEVLAAAMAVQEPALAERGIALRWDLEAGIVLNSYPGALGQAAANFVSNALTHAFAPGTPGQVLIRTRSKAPAQVLLEFSDNGAGIAQADLGRVFDPFFTTCLGQGSSGLGLHIVYNLVVGLLGGSIEVRSRPGEGATFSLLLPLVSPSATGVETF